MLMPGDWVEVRSQSAVAGTLAPDGTLEQLPFMPEMARCCGARFQVRTRAGAACVYGELPGTRGFRALENCVVLEGVRCDGTLHGGCQLSCMFLWKEQWLRKVDGPGNGATQGTTEEGSQRFPATRADDPERFVCQATELVRASRPAPPARSLAQYVTMVRDGTLSLPQLASMFGQVAESKALHGLRSFARRAAPTAAQEQLGLQPGEWVRVRSRAEIVATLGDAWAHKGLGFSPGMFSFCGRRTRVAGRVERLLFEGTGRLRTLKNTVTLEGAVCTRFRGCAREMPYLWREVWLERS